MPDPDVSSSPGQQPLVLIPVTAEDMNRRKWRLRMYIAGAVVVVLGLAGYLYKRAMDPMQAQESFDAGTRLYKIARYNQAILSFDRVIALQPKFADAYLMRGRAYQQDSKPELAIRDFTKVIQLRPSDPAAWAGRAALLLELDDTAGSIKDASQAIGLDPKLSSVYNLRGTAYRKSGDLKKSLEDLSRAVELDATADNYYQRGATYQALGEHKLAIADFDRVIAIIPDLATPFFARAESRRALGDEIGAAEDHLHGRVLDGR